MAKRTITGKLGKKLQAALAKKRRPYLAELVTVLFDPNAFFNLTRREDDLAKPISFLGITVAISAAITSLMIMVVGMLGVQYGNMSMSFVVALSAGFFFTLVVLSMLLAIIMAGILHILMRALGGVGEYHEALKAYCYGSAPRILNPLAMFIPLGSIATGIWKTIIIGFGLSEYYGTTKERGVMVSFLPLIVGFFMILLSIPVFMQLLRTF